MEKDKNTSLRLQVPFSSSFGVKPGISTETRYQRLAPVREVSGPAITLKTNAMEY